MTHYIEAYFEQAQAALGRILRESGAEIERAAVAVADSIQGGGILMLFGSGHSALIAKDAAYRAGGLAATLTIDDVADGDAERLEGLARYLASRYDLRPGNVMAIISNSGINAVPVEMAQIARAAGLTTIAITSLAHSRSMNSRHSSGKKLYELTDMVIDTCGVPGDASVSIPGVPTKTGALSTLCGSAVVQALTVQTVGLLAERGFEAPVWVSANVADSEGNNQRLLERYRPLMARYQMAGPLSGAQTHGR